MSGFKSKVSLTLTAVPVPHPPLSLTLTAVPVPHPSPLTYVDSCTRATPLPSYLR
ncbi:predicted protein [Nematostella vectensis]|uniref:Uncharacterized protein n=1 Tax=Nematostella vectensis TaxID=45351 RepID=A7SR77_NEMVE|nr:predicted protein [Nematostella vectensis]|eukprot:XP_001625896.1 predicted protein [Nematostella vectensis]